MNTTADDATTSISCEATVAAVNGVLVVVLTKDASAALPSRGQVAVTGTIQGRELETVVEPDGRRGHWIRVDAQAPWGRGLGAGDVVSLNLAPSAEWPDPELPADLQKALDGAPDVADLWTSITPMARWEWVRWVRATKNPATRARRVEVSVSKMRSGKRRPCCFDLSACTDPDVARSGKLVTEDQASTRG